MSLHAAVLSFDCMQGLLYILGILLRRAYIKLALRLDLQKYKRDSEAPPNYGQNPRIPLNSKN